MACNVRCVPVRSRWVYQFILTAGCELAVWFKNGVCCLYPHTTPAWFTRAIAAPRPGHYVHQFLYKKMPYRIIRPPCPAAAGGGGAVPVPCCNDPVPTTLHLTGNLGVGTLVLTYDGSRYWASSSRALSCGATAQFRLECTGIHEFDFALDVTCDGTLWVPMGLDLGTASCAPFNLDYALLIGGFDHCSPCNATLTATITT